MGMTCLSLHFYRVLGENYCSYGTLSSIKTGIYYSPPPPSNSYFQILYWQIWEVPDLLLENLRGALKKSGLDGPPSGWSFPWKSTGLLALAGVVVPGHSDGKVQTFQGPFFGLDFPTIKVAWGPKSDMPICMGLLGKAWGHSEAGPSGLSDRIPWAWKGEMQPKSWHSSTSVLMHLCGFIDDGKNLGDSRYEIVIKVILVVTIFTF